MRARTPSPAFVVADAEPRDVPDIVRMAGELSRQEGDPDAFFTEARAHDDLFGPAPWLGGIVGRVEQAAVGVLLWHLAYETAYAARGAYVVSLWVDAPFRRAGLATAMMEAAADRVARRGGSYLWWASKPGNARAHATYSAWGAGSEPVFAHALVRDRFTAFARAGRKAQKESPQ